MPNECLLYIWWNHRVPEGRAGQWAHKGKDIGFDPTGESQDLVYLDQFGQGIKSDELKNVRRSTNKQYEILGLGHAGLRLWRPRGDHHYITWFGGRDESGVQRSIQETTVVGYTAQMRAAAPEIAQRYGGKLIFEQDAARYGGPAAARKVLIEGSRIDSLGSDKIYENKITDPFGVDTLAIKNFWEGYLKLPNDAKDIYYRGLSKTHNCAGMVARALSAGGLGFYAKAPNNLIFQGVRTLYTWAKEGQKNINALNRLWNRILEQPPVHRYKEGKNVLEIRFENTYEMAASTIPSLEEWKKLSYVGPFARRIDQVAKIDNLVQAYHSTADIDEKLKAALLMMALSLDHLAEKPTSDRRVAVILLLSRVVKTIEYLTVKRKQEAAIVNFLAHGLAHMNQIAKKSKASSIDSEWDERTKREMKKWDDDVA